MHGVINATYALSGIITDALRSAASVEREM